MERFVVHLLAIGLALWISLVSADLKNEYDHAAFLDPTEKYKLYWSVKDADKSIHFAVQVNTTGWVGFGISAGLSGSMKGADIVIGWVDSQGKGHIKDYHGQLQANDWPIEDKHQNYEHVASSETNGITIMKFKRKQVTCDKEDRDIPLGTAKVIYAYGNTDTVAYHKTNRGARSLNLLNYVKSAPPPKTAKYFDVLSINAAVPSDKTTYWCQALKLSKLVQLTGKKHIIEIEPLVADEDRGVVHHMVVFICKDDFNETHLNVTGPCFHHNMPPSIKECTSSSVMYAWAVGGVNFKFPDHVGWPIGAADSMKYVILQTHFDNPTQTKGFVVTNGLRMYYDTPRKYDAAMLTTGMAANKNLIVPPKQDSWILKGSCLKSCSAHINERRTLKGGEVKFFASFPHAHTAGTGIWTKIFRNGKEVQELIRDDNYDFDYQRDEMMTFCRYNSKKRKNATIGGKSTTEEMCFNFILYYPSANLSACYTVQTDGINDFQMKYGKLKNNGNALSFKTWEGVTWNKTMVDELSKVYQRENKNGLTSICYGEGAKTHYKGPGDPPIIKEYLPAPKSVCTDTTGAAVTHRADRLFFLVFVFQISLLMFCK